MSTDQAMGKRGNGHLAPMKVVNEDGTEEVKDYTFLPFSAKDKNAYSDRLKKATRKAALDTVDVLREEVERIRKILARGTTDIGEVLSDDDKVSLRMRGFRFNQDADTHFKKLNDSIAAGDYEFGNEISVESMGNIEGLSYLAFLSLKEKHPGISMDECVKLCQENYDAVSLALRIANGTVPVPNAKKEAEKTSSETEKSRESTPTTTVG